MTVPLDNLAGVLAGHVLPHLWAKQAATAAGARAWLACGLERGGAGRGWRGRSSAPTNRWPLLHPPR